MYLEHFEMILGIVMYRQAEDDTEIKPQKLNNM